MAFAWFWSQGLQFSYFWGGATKMLAWDGRTGKGQGQHEGLRGSGKVQGKVKRDGVWVKLVNNGVCSIWNISWAHWEILKSLLCYLMPLLSSTQRDFVFIGRQSFFSRLFICEGHCVSRKNDKCFPTVLLLLWGRNKAVINKTLTFSWGMRWKVSGAVFGPIGAIVMPLFGWSWCCYVIYKWEKRRLRWLILIPLAICLLTNGLRGKCRVNWTLFL